MSPATASISTSTSNMTTPSPQEKQQPPPSKEHHHEHHSQLPNLKSITDPASHDEAYKAGTASENPTPTFIFVTSHSHPSCQTAHPRVLDLAHDNPDLAVYVMELTASTAPMIKFGVQNCPIFILLRGGYCETFVGGRSLDDAVRRVGDMIKMK